MGGRKWKVGARSGEVGGLRSKAESRSGKWEVGGGKVRRWELGGGTSEVLSKKNSVIAKCLGELHDMLDYFGPDLDRSWALLTMLEPDQFQVQERKLSTRMSILQESGGVTRHWEMKFEQFEILKVVMDEWSGDEKEAIRQRVSQRRPCCVMLWLRHMKEHFPTPESLRTPAAIAAIVDYLEGDASDWHSLDMELMNAEDKKDLSRISRGKTYVHHARKAALKRFHTIHTNSNGVSIHKPSCSRRSKSEPQRVTHPLQDVIPLRMLRPQSAQLAEDALVGGVVAPRLVGGNRQVEGPNACGDRRFSGKGGNPLISMINSRVQSHAALMGRTMEPDEVKAVRDGVKEEYAGLKRRNDPELQLWVDIHGRQVRERRVLGPLAARPVENKLEPYRQGLIGGDPRLPVLVEAFRDKHALQGFPSDKEVLDASAYVVQDRDVDGLFLQGWAAVLDSFAVLASCHASRHGFATHSQ